MDPLDETHDPLDEAALEPDDHLVRGGADPEGGFHASAAESRRRVALLQSAQSYSQSLSADSRRRRRAFLRALAQTGNVGMACAAAGWSRSAANALRRADEAFSQSWSDALDTAADIMEAAAFQRAVHGVERENWRLDKEGNPVHVSTTVEYSDQLLVALLKGARPEKFRENHRVEHEAGSKGGVLLLPAAVPLQDWEAAAAAQQAQYREAREPE